MGIDDYVEKMFRDAAKRAEERKLANSGSAEPLSEMSLQKAYEYFAADKDKTLMAQLSRPDLKLVKPTVDFTRMPRFDSPNPFASETEADWSGDLGYSHDRESFLYPDAKPFCPVVVSVETVRRRLAGYPDETPGLDMAQRFLLDEFVIRYPTKPLRQWALRVLLAVKNEQYGTPEWLGRVYE